MTIADVTDKDQLITSHHKVGTSQAATDNAQRHCRTLWSVREIHLKAHTPLIMTQTMWHTWEFNAGHAGNQHKQADSQTHY